MFLSPCLFCRVCFAVFLSPCLFHRICFAVYVSPRLFCRICFTVSVLPCFFRRVYFAVSVLPCFFRHVCFTVSVLPCLICRMFRRVCFAVSVSQSISVLPIKKYVHFFCGYALCTRTSCTLRTHCIHSAHSLHALCTRTTCTLHTHCMNSAHPLHVLCAYTAHSLHTLCLLVYTLCTPSAHSQVSTHTENLNSWRHVACALTRPNGITRYVTEVLLNAVLLPHPTMPWCTVHIIVHTTPVAVVYGVHHNPDYPRGRGVRSAS